MSCHHPAEWKVELTESEYLSAPGFDVMLAHDFYPEGHQGGVSIIHHDQRIATNGDLRLESSPGQWSPVPQAGERRVNAEIPEISVSMHYPDSSKNRKGFNPVIYPDLQLNYTIRVQPVGRGIQITVDLDKPLPQEWVGKVGFNLELFPGLLFGKGYLMDEKPGQFPRQLNGPMQGDDIRPLATGNVLTLAPENDTLRLTIENRKGDLVLLDGRDKQNNGWFIVRSLIASGDARQAIAWTIQPSVIPDFSRSPVWQYNQAGYAASEPKVAVYEMERGEHPAGSFHLVKVLADGSKQEVKSATPNHWGDFLRYTYYTFDFSDVHGTGLYQLVSDQGTSSVFPIDPERYDFHIWQPTLETYLPVQMCHMLVKDRYRTWHGRCHLDDALMAPVDTNHFDGYVQGSATGTNFQHPEHVPGLNRGGWHDAGDYDLRIESQAKTVYNLALIYELFDISYDNTTVDADKMVAELHTPDGVPDVVQQLRHGLESIVPGYQSLGRFYRGIICPTLEQYVLLGDAVNMTDNLIYDPRLDSGSRTATHSGIKDDRWIFTQDNPSRDIVAAAALAASFRALRNGSVGEPDAVWLEIAEATWRKYETLPAARRTLLAVELALTTKDQRYQDFLIDHMAELAGRFRLNGWMLSRIRHLLPTEAEEVLLAEAKAYSATLDSIAATNPYGVPYTPNIWGAGWGIQRMGMQHYFLTVYFPEVFDWQMVNSAYQFMLGCHPGSNNASLVSGVGANSLVVAYGINRADWSYIPGGVGSGTALIRPDFPEMKTWPYLWQQTEYVMGGGGTDFLFLSLANRDMLSKGFGN